RQRQAELGRFPLEKAVRHLHENAGAVSRVGFASTGATVLEIEQDLQSVLNNLMRFAVFQVGDKTHATGVVFILWIIESLRTGLDVRHDRPHFETVVSPDNRGPARWHTACGSHGAAAILFACDAQSVAGTGAVPGGRRVRSAGGEDS